MVIRKRQPPPKYWIFRGFTRNHVDRLQYEVRLLSNKSIRLMMSNHIPECNNQIGNDSFSLLNLSGNWSWFYVHTNTNIYKESTIPPLHRCTFIIKFLLMIILNHLTIQQGIHFMIGSEIASGAERILSVPSLIDKCSCIPLEWYNFSHLFEDKIFDYFLLFTSEYLLRKWFR